MGKANLPNKSPRRHAAAMQAGVRHIVLPVGFMAASILPNAIL
jgi:hypothetical protein